MKTNLKMVVTDLDGTLLDRFGKLSGENRNTLLRLGDENIIRVVATGRNLFSAERVLELDFPIDYLIFSTGAGVMDWRTKQIINKYQINKNEVKNIASSLIKYRCDFMIHQPIPNNHYFEYYTSTSHNPDFDRRIGLYSDYSTPNNESIVDFGDATQFVIIIKNNSYNKICDNNAETFKKFCDMFPSFKVIRTTSPLDNDSLWIEIFPNQVSKSISTEYLSHKLSIDKECVMCIGNDYNDIDMLDWSVNSYVVDNAPTEMKQKFKTVSSNDENGFSEAVKNSI